MPTSPETLQVITVTIEDVPQTYDIYERYVYINAEAEDTVVLNYIFRPETQYWPPTFTMWVIFRLASVLALSVTRKADIASSYTTLADAQFRRAKARDSQQVTTQGLRLSRFNRARLGSGIFQEIEGT